MLKKVKVRSLLIGGFFTLFFVALIVNLYQVQVVDGPIYLAKAEKNWETDRVLQPERGSILDRKNKIMAEDAPAFTVAVNPEMIHKRGIEDRVVEGLAPILGMTGRSEEQKLYSLVTQKTEEGNFYKHVEIRNEGWKIDGVTADKIKRLIEDDKLKGVYLLEERKRYYPANDLAAHILGYTNKDGEPVLGLEMQYHDVLDGTPGSISYEKDLLGYELPDAKVTYKPAVDGKSIRLTIDRNIQHYLEKALDDAYEKYHPKSMMAIAVEPDTLEVLGLANLPNFNPNQYWDFNSQGDFTNHAIRSIYEPGSTFKIVTLAGAVEEGIFHPDDTYLSGEIEVPGATIDDHNWGKGWGEITYLEGLKRSSNVAFVKLGYEGLGGEKLRNYIEKFGFGTKTGIDLPGEEPGLISFRANIPSEIATATFGQGKVQVTAIQQVNAMAAIANGGKLMEPHIVKEIIDQETGKVMKTTKPKEIRRVISEQTAKKVSEYLEQVISDREIGTGRKAYIEGYRVAGKTGTAQKVVDGAYSNDKYIVSFIGFAPVENPRVVVCVIVDEPQLPNGDYRGGGDVVIPIFKDIMQQTLRYMGVPSFNNEEAEKAGDKGRTVQELHELKQVKAPDLIELTVSAASAELNKRDLAHEILGNGRKVVEQFPLPGTEMVAGQRMYILTQSKEQISVPEFTGKSMRDTLKVCTILRMKCQVSGEGYVVNQNVSGTGNNRIIALEFKPYSLGGVKDDSLEAIAEQSP